MGWGAEGRSGRCGGVAKRCPPTHTHTAVRPCACLPGYAGVQAPGGLRAACCITVIITIITIMLARRVRPPCCMPNGQRPTRPLSTTVTSPPPTHTRRPTHPPYRLALRPNPNGHRGAHREMGPRLWDGCRVGAPHQRLGAHCIGSVLQGKANSGAAGRGKGEWGWGGWGTRCSGPHARAWRGLLGERLRRGCPCGSGRGEAGLGVGRGRKPSPALPSSNHPASPCGSRTTRPHASYAPSTPRPSPAQTWFRKLVSSITRTAICIPACATDPSAVQRTAAHRRCCQRGSRPRPFISRQATMQGVTATALQEE